MKVYLVMDTSNYYGPEICFFIREKAQGWIDQQKYPDDFIILELEVQ